MAEQRLIDANAFKENMFKYAAPEMLWDMADIVHKIDEMPIIEERKKGHWKRYNTYHGDDTSGFVDPDWRCSECGRKANINGLFMYDLTDFCPNCGAEMSMEGQP